MTTQILTERTKTQPTDAEHAEALLDAVKMRDHDIILERALILIERHRGNRSIRSLRKHFRIKKLYRKYRKSQNDAGN